MGVEPHESAAPPATAAAAAQVPGLSGQDHGAGGGVAAPGPDTALPTPVAEAGPAGRAAQRGRYAIVEHDGVACLMSTGTSNVRLYVQRGLTVSEASRKDYQPQTVFIDGVYAGAPFLDNERRHYALDHHAGCVRAFTRASCEQAAVLLLQAMPLHEGDWQLYLNEPDLDAVLAAWILLNYAELRRDNAQLLRQAMPLVHVEALIDAYGLELSALSPLSPELYAQQQRTIEGLLSEERRLKEAGQWQAADPLAYAQGLLARLDEALIPGEVLAGLLAIQELGRVKLGDGKLAIWCQSRQGIYAVETHYRRLLDQRLAVLVLDAGGGRFTLLQVDRFLGHHLQELYPVLDEREPRALAPEDRWGGATDIGGSPRASGSGLTGAQILRAIVDVYGGGGFWSRLVRRFVGRR